MTRYAPIALLGIAIVGVLIAGVTLVIVSDGDAPPDADVADTPDTPDTPDEPEQPDETDQPDEPAPAPTPTATPERAPTDGAGESDRDGADTDADDDRVSPGVDTDADDDRDLTDRGRGPPGGDAGSDREIAGRQPRSGALPSTGGVPGSLALGALAGGLGVGRIRLAARRCPR